VGAGESTFAVIRREVVPNILAPVLVDFGLRFTYSILIIARSTSSVSGCSRRLGLGAADQRNASTTR